MNSHTNYYSSKQNLPSAHRLNKGRWLFALGATAFAFLCIWGRLFYLQIVKGEFFMERAQASTSYLITEYAPRGLIYDREHRVLASNQQSPTLFIIPQIVLQTRFEKTTRVLASILERRPEKLREEIRSLGNFGSKPIPLVEKLSLEEVAAIYEHQYELPGIIVQQQSTRYYICSEACAHVLGYTGSVNSSEMGKDPKYRLHDVVGKYGVEKIYDGLLRGDNYHKRILIDRTGQPVNPVNPEEVARSAAHSGKSLTLTIDLDLQRVAAEALGEMRGAVVLISVQSGEILALVSKPSFDLNMFARKVSSEQWKSMRTNKALLNRAISPYPPGSIWKPVVLLAALESGAVRAEDKFKVSGAIYLNGYRFGDWTSKKDIMTPVEALAWSRDTAFYQMAMRMEDSDISRMGRQFGAGQPTGIELRDEKTGCLPDRAWRRKHDMPWYPGSILHYSIGQGYMLLTPVQAARMAAGLATGESLPKLHLVEQKGSSLPPGGSPGRDSIEVGKEHWRTVREGMIACINGGTCGRSALPYVQVAGKTGSAEAPPYEKTHGWFIAFAPAEDPEIAMAVFTEGAGHGGSTAAPIAQKVLEAYFSKHPPARVREAANAK